MTVTTFPTEPFTIRHARSLGLSREQVRAGVRDGAVRRVLREVYVDRSVELDHRLRARAVALVAAPHLVACDRTASWIHGVEAWHYRELDVPPPLELCALRGREPSERPEVRCLTRDLLPVDLVRIDGLLVTTPLRTALDLGSRLPRRDAYATMNALAAAHGFGAGDLVRVLPRYRRRRGCVQLKQLAPMVEPRMESRRESWVHLEIADHGLPLPTPQHWISIGGVPTYRLDLAYPHARIAIEYDGEEHHTSVEARAHDDARRAWLRSQGWLVLVVTKADFARDSDAAWISVLAAALHARSRG